MFKVDIFQISNFLLLKWQLFQYNVKFEADNFFYIVLASLFSKSIVKNLRNPFRVL